MTCPATSLSHITGSFLALSNAQASGRERRSRHTRCRLSLHRPAVDLVRIEDLVGVDERERNRPVGGLR